MIGSKSVSRKSQITRLPRSSTEPSLRDYVHRGQGGIVRLLSSVFASGALAAHAKRAKHSTRIAPCPVSQLLIKGIRSFSPDNLNVIEFYRPLTLIVGANGAGKTVRERAASLTQLHMVHHAGQRLHLNAVTHAQCIFGTFLWLRIVTSLCRPLSSA